MLNCRKRFASLTERATIIIQGKQRGADQMAERWAAKSGLDCLGYPAAFTTVGPIAGRIRNRHMLMHGRPKIVVAFPGDVGTANMIDQATAAGLKVFKVTK